MKRKFLLFLLALIIFLTVLVLWLTQDGSLDTPKGEGIVRLEADEFEAFPLPKYVAEELSSSYKSYFIEVAKGIKIHVLEVGSGYPVLLQHGNPTSGLLYRKVAEHLPTNQLRLIMPTLVGLGYSSKVPASQHTLSNHVEWLSEAIAQLQLKQLIFVGQDWGGPIGMGALSQAPTLLQGAIILNTGLNAPKEKRSLSSILATYQKFFCCDVHFSQDFYAVDLSRKLVEKTIQQADSNAAIMATQYFSLHVENTNIEAQVIQLIHKLLATGCCNIDTIAAQLNLHKRTFQRRMAERNLIFTDILDKQRKTLALRYLTESTLPIVRIVGLLGYSDQSAFSRSCKRWFAAPPKQIRDVGLIK